jgi:hypothetical protein
LYFISNQVNRPQTFDALFRVTGKKPELWDAVTGKARALPAYKMNRDGTTLPLMLDANGSAFIVFRGKLEEGNTVHGGANFPVPSTILEINTPWQVRFDTARWGPEKPVVFNQLTDWTKSNQDNIKYYSGTAVYHNHFTMAGLKKGQRILLDLGTLFAMARVRINGVDAGAVWTAPYQLDITAAIRNGRNTLEIAVVNTWVNRLIGDLHLPEKERKTWVNVNPYRPGSPLEPSGLLGPVTIRSVPE